MPRDRVLIDGYFMGKPYGFGRVIHEMCHALDRVNHELDLVVAVPDGVPQDLLFPSGSLRWHRLEARNFAFWEQVAIPKAARELGCTVIHSPYNTSPLLTRGARSVVTVHDIMFLEDWPHDGGLKDKLAAMYARMIFQNLRYGRRKVLTGSETTRHALERIGIASTAVHNTADAFLSSLGARPANGSIRPYLVHRGGYSFHRNTLRVIEAYRMIRESIPGIELRIFGVPRAGERWNVREGEGIEFLPRLPDAELAAVYAGSRGVVATSLKEGFGMPILEGFGCGVPVLTSNLDPMREVAGNAALLVDPSSVPAIADGMRRIVTDPELARRLVSAGKERAKVYGSEQLARRIVDAYRDECRLAMRSSDRRAEASNGSRPSPASWDGSTS